MLENNIKIRLLKSEDIPRVLEIYSYYIESTNVSFEYTVPSIEEFVDRTEGIRAEYPYLVIEKNSKILGYAYAHKHMERVAYQWNVELSIYLDKDSTGLGLGKMLYEKLIQILQKQNIVNMYSLVCVPNPQSEKLHKSFGFDELYTLQKTGYKLGEWLDVVCYHKTINEIENPPKEFKKIYEIDINDII